MLGATFCPIVFSVALDLTALMTPALLLSILALSASGVALITAGIALYARQTHPEVARIQAEITALNDSLTDHADRVNHWMRRDATRNARAAREAPLAMQPAELSPAQRKLAIRQRASLHAIGGNQP